MSFSESQSFFISRESPSPAPACHPKTRPIAYRYRAQVLGQALLAARTDANSLSMLLSWNAEVAFPSTAMSFPTPATAADAISPTNWAASTTSISAVDIVATPSVYQKRNARP
jgi:hypothetical protein